MPIVFVSSVPFGGGERLARSLADKLGCAFLTRDDVVARANESGIPVGKLEVAMVHKPAVQERLARLKDRYLAVATATICEKAAEGDLVYFGRAGQLLLPGVTHVVRVRVIPEHGQRVETAVQRTKLTPEKAETFLQDIDSDVRAWVHFVHGVEMDDLRRYDFIVNLENMSIENAATALCGIAQLPDFRPTPASQRAMEERLLQSRARIRLALDERTADADLTVRAAEGVVTISYVPRQSSVAPAIPEVLGDLPGCREVRTTVATTNILWVQEEFRPDSPALGQVAELARRWGAAVELLRFRPDAAGDGEPVGASPAPLLARRPETGGIEDDVAEPQRAGDEGFHQALAVLVQQGRSGGGQTVAGGQDRLLTAVNRTIPYSLVVVGDVFLTRPSAARTRMARDLGSFLARHFKAPVISTADLGEQLRFGTKRVIQTAAALAIMVLLYLVIFQNQGTVIDILGGTYHQQHRWVAPVVVALVAPLVAGLYGLVAASLLKLIRLE
ncbi:MAG: AAA family ATPase [Acidobacteriota bacterium]